MSIKSPYASHVELGQYSAIIYKEGASIVAKDNQGDILGEGTNATTVINSIITTVYNLGGGRIVLLRGEYTLSAAVTLPKYDKYLEFVGLEYPKLKMDFDGSAIGSYWEGSWGKIDSLEIDCNSKQGEGIKIERPSRNFSIENCTIHGITHTVAGNSNEIYITASDHHSSPIGLPEVIIKDCVIYDFHNANGINSNFPNAYITGNMVYDGTSIGSDIGIYLQDGGKAIGNTVYDCVGGIMAEDMGVIHGNYAISNKLQGIVPKKNCSAIGNLCMFNKQNGIDLWYTTHSTISGNVCINNGADITQLPDSNGIDVDNHSSYNIIDSNICGNSATDWTDTLKDAATAGNAFITVNLPHIWFLYTRINIDGENKTITGIDLPNYKLTLDSVLGSNHAADASVAGVNTQQLGIRLSASEAAGSDYNIVTNNYVYSNLGGTYVKSGDTMQPHTYCDQWKYLTLPNDGFVVDGTPLWYNDTSNDFLAIHIGSGTWKKVQLS